MKPLLFAITFLILITNVVADSGQADARVKHKTLYGYLRDANPATDGILVIYSPRKHLTLRVAVTDTTTFKDRGLTVPRSSFTIGMYIHVTYTANGKQLIALHVTIAHKRKSHKKVA